MKCPYHKSCDLYRETAFTCNTDTELEYCGKYRELEMINKRSVEKCCYSDIEKICLNPAFELRQMGPCKPETCDLYYESDWYFESVNSASLRSKE